MFSYNFSPDLADNSQINIRLPNYSVHFCSTEGRWNLKDVGSFPRMEVPPFFFFHVTADRATACPTKVQATTFHLSGVVETCQRKGEEEKGKGMNMLFVSMI